MSIQRYDIRARAQNGAVMDVQRYTMAATYGMHHKAPMVVWDWDVDGEWVRYDDHAAEVARLREAGFELHRQIGVHEANAALLESDVARLTQAKDGAYRERNMLVCALTKVFPSWLARHPETDTEWENDWRWIIFVQLPTGQASWHIHDSERAMFDHLPVGMNSWDGHTNDEKYQRIAALTARKDGAS